MLPSLARQWLIAAVLILGLLLQQPPEAAPAKPAKPDRPLPADVGEPIKKAIDTYLARTVDDAVDRAVERITAALETAAVKDEPEPEQPVAPAPVDQLPPQLPSGPGLGVAVVTSDKPGGWVILKFSQQTGFIGVEPIVLEGGTVAIWEGEPGGYAVLFFEQGKLQPKIFNVTIGGVKPPDPVEPVEPVDPTDPQKKTTRVTYVYEKDQGNTPRQVAAALQRINAAGTGVVASEFEEDSTDGNGEVPDQYKIALAEARKVGLPAMVVQSGDTVKRVVKDPRTEQEVMQAIAP